MWKFILLVIVTLAIALFGLSLMNVARDNETIQAESVFFLPSVGINSGDFAQVAADYDWQFPADHAAHPEFQMERWLFRGILNSSDSDSSDHIIGWQVTLIRYALTSEKPESDSEWRSNQVYLAQVALTDESEFYQAERLNRDGAQVAGATAEKLWLEDWSVSIQDNYLENLIIETPDFSLSLVFQSDENQVPMIMEHQISARGGNAAYAYLVQLPAEGTVTIKNQEWVVHGDSWMTHEFKTGLVLPGVVGWQHMELQLDDGRLLFLTGLRRLNGRISPINGLLMDNQSVTVIPADAFSEGKNAGNWNVHTDDLSGTFSLLPIVDNQVFTGNLPYESALMHISGDISGYGYVEIAGYDGSPLTN